MDMLRSEVSGKGLLLSILPDAQRAWVLATLEKRKAARLSYGTQESTEKFIADIDKYRAQLISGRLWKEKEKPAKVRERKPAKKETNVLEVFTDDTLRSAVAVPATIGSRAFFSYDVEASPVQGDAIPVLQERE